MASELWRDRVDASPGEGLGVLIKTGLKSEACRTLQLHIDISTRAVAILQCEALQAPWNIVIDM